MGKQRHLDRAPILEALIDLQFDPVTDIDLSAVAVELSNGEPASVSDFFRTMFELKLEKDALPQTTSFADSIGKRIDLSSQRRVIQLRNNGFTFSRLAPYETWEEMADAALAAWDVFAKRIGAGKISRIAIRYINVLQLPLPLESFDQYLTSAPQIPDELQQGISAFLTRVVCPQKEDMLTITQSLEGEVNEGKSVKVILDIEVSHECRLDRQDIASVDLVLKRLRACKNDAFFAYLTDDALEMYK